tara:strand:- start:179 stop:373 length:195 start_codon:yes stop_codon:yes gene_type:complete
MCDIMKYKGMTVNERLYVGGFMDKFDKAVKDKDVDKVRSILKKVELTEPSIKPILESYGLSSEE